MPDKLQITYKDFPAPLLADERIRERMDRLEKIFPRIVSCRVVAEELDTRPHKGKLYHLRIDVSVPGAELVVNRSQHDNHAHEDFYVAMRDAFNAMERQLKAHAEKARGDVKTHEAPAPGEAP